MSKHVKIMFIYGFDMSHASKSCRCLPVIHNGLYVMHKGQPVAERVCLSCAMTTIMIHTCHNDVMIQV